MSWSRSLLACLSFIVLVPVAARAQLKAGPDDWPGWRGADRTGISPETGLLKEWPAGGPKLVWKAGDLGEGYSTPSVAGGRVYLMGGKISQNEEFLLALDAKDGARIWSVKVGAVGANPKSTNYPGPRCTPTVDGDRLYALGSAGDLVCVDLSGKILWRKNLAKDFDGRRGAWAYSESPLIDGDVLVCTPGGPKTSLAALDKTTGSVIWTSQVPSGGEAAYASVIVAHAGGAKQYVQMLRNGIVGVSAKDGKYLWSFDKGAGTTNGCTPVYHDGFVFESIGGTGSMCALFELTPDGPARKVYENRALTNHHGGVVLIGGHLYGTDGKGLVCLDFKSGDVKWRNPSVGKGSVSAADGHLYVRSESKGEVALVLATPEGYKEKGRFSQPERSSKKAWCHPVIAGGRLYLRDENILLCFDIKAK